jgi:hypothetical protein
MRLSLYRAIQDAAFEDGHPEEIYLGVPTGTRLWDGKGGRLDKQQDPTKYSLHELLRVPNPERAEVSIELKETVMRRQSGKHRKHTPPELVVTDKDTGLFFYHIATPMFRLALNPELPKRTTRKYKQVFKNLVRQGHRLVAIKALAHLEASV